MAQEDTERTGQEPEALLGANVYRLRVMRIPAWSRERLAQESGVSASTIKAIERARDPKNAGHSVGLDIVKRLARTLGVGVAELFRDDEQSRVYLRGHRPLSAIDGGRTGPVGPKQAPTLAAARS